MDEDPTIHSALPDNSPAKALEQLSDSEFWDYARKRADSLSTVAQHQEYLECELASGPCLIPLSELLEVVLPAHHFARLPGMPGWMRGLVAWQGETIAVVDLDAYLSGSTASINTPGGSLLIANSQGLPIALFVSAIGLMTTIAFEQLAPSPSSGASVLYTPRRAGVVRGTYAEALVLDVPVLLADVVQQIEMATYHG